MTKHNWNWNRWWRLKRFRLRQWKVQTMNSIKWGKGRVTKVGKNEWVAEGGTCLAPDRSPLFLTNPIIPTQRAISNQQTTILKKEFDCSRTSKRVDWNWGICLGIGTMQCIIWTGKGKRQWPSIDKMWGRKASVVVVIHVLSLREGHLDWKAARASASELFCKSITCAIGKWMHLSAYHNIIREERS